MVLHLPHHPSGHPPRGLGRIASGPGPYSFTNIHYSHEAAVFFGDETHGGYEYSGKVYTGRQPFANHMGRYDDCAECHKATNTLRGVREASDHNSKTPNPADCVFCHGQDVSQPYPGADPALFVFTGIRPVSIPDYDGDGNRSESIRAEIQGLEARLYAQIQAYGFAIGDPVVVDLYEYPFFFRDANGNGLKDPGENIPTRATSPSCWWIRSATSAETSPLTPGAEVQGSKCKGLTLALLPRHIRRPRPRPGIYGCPSRRR